MLLSSPLTPRHCLSFTFAPSVYSAPSVYLPVNYRACAPGAPCTPPTGAAQTTLCSPVKMLTPDAAVVYVNTQADG